MFLGTTTRDNFRWWRTVRFRRCSRLPWVRAAERARAVAAVSIPAAKPKRTTCFRRRQARRSSTSRSPSQAPSVEAPQELRAGNRERAGRGSRLFFLVLWRDSAARTLLRDEPKQAISQLCSSTTVGRWCNCEIHDCRPDKIPSIWARYKERGLRKTGARRNERELGTTRTEDSVTVALVVCLGQWGRSAAQNEAWRGSSLQGRARPTVTCAI
mmetsp:Transcript_17036/g.42219  ORF Transcript_17036/g.42219 Transcript_17036/m.42219 type:complete len:213 (+) Transcript_17036:637-1275(+)